MRSAKEIDTLHFSVFYRTSRGTNENKGVQRKIASMLGLNYPPYIVRVLEREMDTCCLLNKQQIKTSLL